MIGRNQYLRVLGKLHGHQGQDAYFVMAHLFFLSVARAACNNSYDLYHKMPVHTLSQLLHTLFIYSRCENRSQLTLRYPQLQYVEQNCNTKQVISILSSHQRSNACGGCANASRRFDVVRHREAELNLLSRWNFGDASFAL